MKVSLRSFYDAMLRKAEPVDPSTLPTGELLGMLHGEPEVVSTIERHLETHPELWHESPAGMARELARLPSVGKAAAAWYVLAQIWAGRRVAAAVDELAAEASTPAPAEVDEFAPEADPE